MRLVKNGIEITTENENVIRAYKMNGWEEAEAKAEKPAPKRSTAKK